MKALGDRGQDRVDDARVDGTQNAPKHDRPQDTVAAPVPPAQAVIPHFRSPPPFRSHGPFASL